MSLSADHLILKNPSLISLINCNGFLITQIIFTFYFQQGIYERLTKTDQMRPGRILGLPVETFCGGFLFSHISDGLKLFNSPKNRCKISRDFQCLKCLFPKYLPSCEFQSGFLMP